MFSNQARLRLVSHTDFSAFRSLWRRLRARAGLQTLMARFTCCALPVTDTTVEPHELATSKTVSGQQVRRCSSAQCAVACNETIWNIGRHSWR